LLEGIYLTNTGTGVLFFSHFKMAAVENSLFLQQENAHLQREQSALEARLTELGLLTTEIEGLKKQAAELHKRSAGLEDQIAEFRRENEALTAKIAQLEVRLAQQDVDIIKLKEDARQAREDARLAKDEAHLVKEDVRLAREDVRLAKEDARLAKEDARLATEHHLEAHNIGLLGQLPISIMSLMREYVFQDVADDIFYGLVRVVRVWSDFATVHMNENQRTRYRELESRWNPSWNKPVHIFTQMRLANSHPNTRSPTDPSPVDSADLKRVAAAIIPTTGWRTRQSAIHVRGTVPAPAELITTAEGLADLADFLAGKVGSAQLLVR
jgi:peptidoglycan hydrolase CwlO-like protein